MARDDLEFRLCRPYEEPASWDVEQVAWAPFNWEARGAVGVDYFPELHVVAAEKATGRLVADDRRVPDELGR